MAQTPLPKPPREFERQGRDIYLWFTRVYKRISDFAQIAWTQLDLTSADLADLATRNHSDLQNIGEVDETDTDTTLDKHVSNLLAKGWEDAKDGYTTHAAASTAHGSTGNILGSGNTASAVTRGPVYRAAASTDATASTVAGSTTSVSVTSADATDLASVITLANEIKGDVNTLASDLNTLAGDVDSLVTDLNAVVASLNDLKAKQRTAEQLST